MPCVPEGRGRTFLLEYSYAGQSPDVKQLKIVDMAMNASGIHDTARVLHVSPTTVINVKKKAPDLQAVNHCVLQRLNPGASVEIWRADELEVRQGAAPNSMRCGATCTAKPIRAGYGTRLITTQAKVLAYVLGRRLILDSRVVMVTFGVTGCFYSLSPGVRPMRHLWKKPFNIKCLNPVQCV